MGGLFDSSETAIDSTTPAPPCSSNRCHDIDNSPETAPRSQLAEQGASTSNSLHPHTPFSRLSSEPLHDIISTEGSRYARSEATTPSSSPPPRHCRASPENQLSQEGRLHTGRDEHELVDHALDTLLIDRGAREEQQQEGEQEKGDGNRFPTSIHLQNRVITRQEADAVVTATMSSTAPTRPGTMRRSHVLPSGSSRPHLTVAKHARSAGALFSRALPASVDLSPSPIASTPGRTPLSTRGQESLQARVPRAECLHQRLLYNKV